MCEDKLKIIKLFKAAVKGKKWNKSRCVDSDKSLQHCGEEGHVLEKWMGLTPNNKNEPDLFGYEMKKDSPKISFGDWSAEEYLFSKNKDLTLLEYQKELEQRSLKTNGNKDIIAAVG